MAIARTVDWILTCSPEEADSRLRAAFGKLDLSPQGAPGHVEGHSKAKLLKNRWSADVIADITPLGNRTQVACRVEMPAGTKHFAVASDVAEAIGDDVFDDRGISAARERLSKSSRLFGWREIRHLRNILRPAETVQALGQGQWGKNQGLLVLTNERLFFFDKTLMSETVEEFPLAAITSLAARKKLSGEALAVFVAGNETAITGMMHGQADAIVRAYNILRDQPKDSPVPAPAPATTVDPLTQIERLAELRDKGLLTPEEFEAKKADLLGRL